MNTLDPELKTYFTKVKDEIKTEHIAYLSQHPEIRQLLNDFLSTMLLRKPEDVYGFAQKYFAYYNQTKEPVQHRPLVISGPSGAGKGTLIGKLFENFPDLFEFSVSYTTREPREGEVDGKDYYFVAKEIFNQEISKNSFVEYCEVHGNFYGTHKDRVKSIMEKGKICILEIDVQGAHKVKSSGAECNYLFVDAPDLDTLRKRLVKRGSENESQIERRMKNAEGELEVAKSSDLYQKFLVNDDLENTFTDLIGVIHEFYPEIDLKLK